MNRCLTWQFFLYYDVHKLQKLLSSMNRNLSGKNLFLIGFVVVLLVGIPLTLYLLQQQSEVRSRAQKSTNIDFNPTSSQTAPIQKQVGDSIPLDIMIDPGQNLVSFVKLEIQYDPTILATASANTFVPNTDAFPGQMEGPIYAPGKIDLTLSVGPDPTKAIQQVTKAGTITFKAIANTPSGTPTLVTFSSNTQVLSIGSTDQFSENVLSSANPATIVIGGAVISPTTGLSQIPTALPSPTISQMPSTMPTETPLPTATPPEVSTIPEETPTLAPSGTSTGAQPPVCSNLSVDRATTGNAPFSITFTANGNDPDGTISNVTFNFGDGQTSQVTSAGGIGTNSVNVQIAHTYNNAGSYQATAVLTDSNNLQSSPSASCQQDITVQNGTPTGGVIAVSGSASATPTIGATGSTGTVLGIAGVAAAFIIGGGLLLFIL